MSTKTEQCRSAIQGLCKQIKMPSFYEAYRQQWDNPSYADMPFDPRLLLLLEAEQRARGYKRQQRLVKNAHLPQGTMARLEKIDWDSQRGLNRPLVEELCDCSWLSADRKPWVTITGMSGVGKSYIGNVLTYQACIHGYSSLYYRLPELISDIEAALDCHRIINFRKMLMSKSLLTIDDFGIMNMNEAIAAEFFTILEQRMGENSLILIAQIPLKGWYTYIGEPIKAEAIMDRVMYQSYHITLKGSSMRSKYAAVKTKMQEDVL